MIYEDKNGSPVEVFAKTHVTGRVEVADIWVSGPNREALEVTSLNFGLMVQDENGNRHNAPNCDCAWIGHPVEQEVVFSQDGETLITPAVHSPDYLANWRFGPRDQLARDEDGFELWLLAAIQFMQQGELVQLSETLRACELHGVRLIDGNEITTPLRDWAE